MDVLNPTLEEIDGAMYRVNLTDYPGCRPDGVYVEDEAEFTNGEFGEKFDDELDPSCSDMPMIEEITQSKGKSFRFRTQFHIPKALHGFLIGTRGLTRQRLENETRTKIMIPKKDVEGDIVVMGLIERYVREAYSRIRTLIASSRRKLSPTHFVSIPLNTSNIREKFEMFKCEVLECCGEQEILKNELFNFGDRLHLTLSVLTLLDEHERELACHRLDECLESVIEPLLKNQPIAVRLRGIEIMNDDPTQVKILYAKVESADDILQRLADAVSVHFKRDGLTKDRFDRDHVKLHVTLMNTEFLERENEESDRRSKPRNNRKFDASKILENFRDFDFGVVIVNTMHLSQMHAYSEDGYYLSSNRIKWA